MGRCMVFPVKAELAKLHKVISERAETETQKNQKFGASSYTFSSSQLATVRPLKIYRILGLEWH